MKTPNFLYEQYVSNTIFNSAMAELISSVIETGSNDVFLIPGVINPSSLVFTYNGNLIVNLTITNTGTLAFKCLFQTGNLCSGHGTSNGVNSGSYTVNFGSFVPGSGSQIVYIVAQYTQVEESIVTIIGPPVGHPDYSSNFNPYNGYTVLQDTLNIIATTTVPDNLINIELARITLSAGQTTITAVDPSHQVLARVNAEYVVMSGDVTGNSNSNVISSWQGKSINLATPGNNNIPVWNGTTWSPGTVPSLNTGPAGGDLGGNYPAPVVEQSSAATFAAKGNATVAGTLVSTGNITASAALNAAGNITTASAVVATQGVVAGTTVTAGTSISAGTTITANGVIHSGNNITATDAVTAGTSISAGTTVTAGTNLVATDAVTAGTSISAGTTVTAGGIIHSGSDITASGDAHITGLITAGGTVSGANASSIGQAIMLGQLFGKYTAMPNTVYTSAGNVYSGYLQFPFSNNGTPDTVTLMFGFYSVYGINGALNNNVVTVNLPLAIPNGILCWWTNWASNDNQSSDLANENACATIELFQPVGAGATTLMMILDENSDNGIGIIRVAGSPSGYGPDNLGMTGFSWILLCR
jgi:hypothetical protein